MRPMKQITRMSLMIIVSIGILLGALDTQAQQHDSAFRQGIEGTWALVSQYIEEGGDALGVKPSGFMVLTPNGRFSIILVQQNLPKFGFPSRVKSTPEENQTVMDGALAYFGSYTVTNEKDETVDLHIEGSSFPNWNGKVQKRVMDVLGDELRVTNPTPVIGGISYAVWKRVN